jgi:hypothetical protein
MVRLQPIARDHRGYWRANLTGGRLFLSGKGRSGLIFRRVSTMAPHQFTAQIRASLSASAPQLRHARLLRGEISEYISCQLF